MRILLWCELYRPDIGGAEVWAAELARAMRARGHEVAAIACNGPQNVPWQYARVNRVPFAAMRSMWGVWQTWLP
jgi:hypothetical protein